MSAEFSGSAGLIARPAAARRKYAEPATVKMARSVAVFVIVVGFSVGFVSPTAQAQNYLFDRAGFATGNDPAGVVVADFNPDRRLDLAVTNFVGNTVSVLLGTLGGGFAAKVDYATGVSPAALVAADFRGDGKVDLAVVNEYDGTGDPGTVSILLGNGDGTFQTHVDYPVGNYPVGIVAADFNGDGTFQSQTLVSVGTEPTSLGSGDFNGDGRVDLITSNVSAGTGTVLLSKGRRKLHKRGFFHRNSCPGF
jgi:hypothetical protein